ncbi:MAG: hypothetical protein AAB896_00805 [Patescibacteria group bacterium]
MQNHPGIFIVLEGSDGSGKGTQFRLLAERLKAVGHEVAVFDFPRYDEISSYFVKRYLNGDYGPASEVSPYTATMFFALDRYEAAPQIKKAIDDGKVVLANRYVGSNMAHQGTRFDNLAQQRGFFMWVDSLEYQLFGIPRPNINLFLKVPPEISFELIAKKTERIYTKRARDELEADIEHLKKAVAAYDLLCQLFPRDFKEVVCSLDGQILSVVEINNLIWQAINPLLPEPKRQGKGVVVRLDLKNNSKTDVEFEGIINLQKQMLSKSGSLKVKNQGQLTAAINLLTPLQLHKSEIKELLDEKTVDRLSIDDEPVSVNKIVEQLAWSTPVLPGDEPIKLLAANPRNEFQLLDQARGVGLNYQQKELALVAELKNVASRANYHFEVTSDYQTLLAFTNEVSASQVIISVASPRLGYAVPEAIETAGLDQPFNKAFKLSGELYKRMLLTSAKDAVYTLLLGHNVRWKFEVDAATLAKAFKTSKNHQLLTFLAKLSEKIAEFHPHVARILSDKKRR